MRKGEREGEGFNEMIRVVGRGYVKSVGFDVWKDVWFELCGVRVKMCGVYLKWYLKW